MIFIPDNVYYLSHSFHSLRLRNYRLYWISQVISLTGSWMQTTAQSWLVLKLTGSPLALGLVNTLQFLPMLLFSLFGGVIADRLPKRNTLLLTQSLALIQAFIFGLLAFTGLIQLWHIYLLAVIQGFISAIDDPVREAFVVEMVGREELVNAIALNNISFNTARAIGPAVAGILIATIGLPIALFLNALSFVAVIVALLKIDRAALFAVPVALHGSLLANFREGLAYVRHTPSAISTFIVVAFVATFGFNFIILLPLLASYVIHLDTSGFGLLPTFVGVGSILAAMVIAQMSHITRQHLLMSGILYGILLGLVAFTQNVFLSGALLIVMGALSTIFSAASSSLLQLAVPNILRGRVMSLSVLFYMGTKPVSALIIGALASNIGTSLAVFVAGLLCLIGVIASIVYQMSSAVEPLGLEKSR